jgi:hypothetical protein
MRHQVDTGQGTRLPGIARVKDASAKVWTCVGGTSRTALQNILMRMPDKVCAVALAMLSESQRLSLYTLIAGTKAARVKEEMRLEKGRRTSPLVRARIIRSFLSYFGQAAKVPGTIWIRPRRAG